MQLEFYRFWSLKESYIKAVGVGLGMDLQTLEFTSSPIVKKEEMTRDAARLAVNDIAQKNWTFEQAYLDEEHCVSVAVGPTTVRRFSCSS
jgi:4'-phosphopantetheinyl transferase